MKKSSFAAPATILLAALFFLMSVAQAEEAAPPRIRVGYFAFSSYQDVDAKGRFSGYGYEYLQEIARHTGWEYEFVFASWDDCLDMLAKGELDLLGSAQRTEERTKLFDYAMLDSGISYAVLCASSNNTELAYEDFEAFDGMRVGLLKSNSRNTALEDYCRENGFSIRMRMFDNQKDLLSALHTGSVDAILTSNLRKDEHERIIARFAPSPFYFITTKGNQAVLQPLNRAITQIKLNNPHFDGDLYQKYYSVDKSDKPVFTRAEREYIRSHPRLRVACNPAWTPLSFRDPKTGQFRGISEGVLQTVAENTGLSFEYIAAPNIEAAAGMLLAGQADIIATIPVTYRFPSALPITVSSSYLSSFTVMATNSQADPADEGKIAITDDYWRSFPNAEDNPRLLRVPTVQDCFDALYSGKVSGAYVNSYAADLLRSNDAFSRFQLTVLPDLRNGLGLGVAQNGDPRLLSILNKSIQAISQEEQQDIILKNTLTTQSLSIRSYLEQHPLPALITVTGVLLMVIAFLCYMAFIRSRFSKKVYSLLYIDSLTGIWNFNHFMRELKQILATDKKKRYAVVYMDIERFKDINETMGYTQGDFILKSIARLLKENVDDDEHYARIGNDNFIALLHYENEASFMQCMLLLHDAFNRIPKNDHENYRLMLTSGVYAIREEDHDPAAVVDCANEARKTIKGRHKSDYAFFNEQLRNTQLAQREIESIMEGALAKGQFVPFYQPKVDLSTSKIIGAEALVRWEHPQRGLIAPFQFIPLFEKNGFIVEVDFYIFECVCQTLRHQLDVGQTPVPISSNFSRVHFTRPGFLLRLNEIADRYQLPPHLLELEITESMMDENSQELLAILNKLRMQGFRIAMDDFGTGYSSLNLLKNMPLDTLKLDKDFLQKGIVCEKDRIIIAGFVEIAKKLDFTVVCEGVETQEQATFLRSIGCDFAQGYLYAKPMPLASFESRLFGKDEERGAS